MSTIITVSDLVSRMGIGQLLDLADIDNEESGSVSEDSATETRIQNAIDEAEETVKSYFRGHVKIDDWAIGEMPKLLKNFTATLAIYFLQRDLRRETLTEDDHMSYKETIKRLQDYSTGKARLSVAQDTADAQSRVVTTTTVNSDSYVKKQLDTYGGYV